MRAGFGRKCLAWFVDAWLFVNVMPPLIGYFGFEPSQYPISMALAFFSLRYVLEQAWTTPGLVALAIDIHDAVPYDIARREDSVSIGLTLVTILAAGQTFSFAFANPQAIPLFGILLPAPLFAVTLVSIAVLMLAAGILTGRMLRAGWWLITSMLALWILSVIAGWPVWQSLVVEMLMAKRQEFGLSVRPAEIEVLPTIAKVILVLPPSIVLLMLIGTFGQFRKSDPVSAPGHP